jgi:hypothetical protein
LKKKKIKPAKLRNPMIVAAFKNEIDLKTKVEPDKKKYNRKEKHKSTYE